MANVTFMFGHTLQTFVSSVEDENVTVITSVDFQQSDLLPIIRKPARKETAFVFENHLTREIGKFVFVQIEKPLVSLIGCDVKHFVII